MKLRNEPKKRVGLDLRIQQATAFLESVAQRLPKHATKAMWQRITPRLVCKRIGWKGSQADFSRLFKKLHGHTLKQHMDGLWKECRERLRPTQRPTLPYTFQMGAGWFYYPGWLPPGTKPGDWVRLEADGTAKKVDGPEMERKAV